MGTVIQGFLDDITENPANTDLWFILADYLEEIEEPRAELTRLFTLLRTEPNSPVFFQRQTRVQELLCTMDPIFPKKTLDLGGVTMDLALIPPGVFQMGSPETEKEREDDEKQHEVELTQPFYLAVTETTQAQYRAITGENPSGFKGDTLPVETVSWNDAVAFCEKLGKKVGAKVSLPSEAQWEYACRAGTTTPFHFGEVLNGDKANCDGNYPYGTTTKGPYLEKTTPAGDARYPSNGFGLRDMHGNVYEWCQDAYRKDYEALGRINPLNVGQPDNLRVLRGGSRYNDAWGCRAAFRGKSAPVNCFNYGFRVVVLP